MPAPLIPIIARVLAGIGLRAGPAMATAARAAIAGVGRTAASAGGRAVATEARAGAGRLLADPNTKRAIITVAKTKAPRAWGFFKTAKRSLPAVSPNAKQVAGDAAELLGRVAPHVLASPTASTRRPREQPAGVPMMITQGMQAQLLKRGYVEQQIREMTPQQAWAAINAQLQPPTQQPRPAKTEAPRDPASEPATDSQTPRPMGPTLAKFGSLGKAVHFTMAGLGRPQQSQPTPTPSTQSAQQAPEPPRATAPKPKTPDDDFVYSDLTKPKLSSPTNQPGPKSTAPKAGAAGMTGLEDLWQFYASAKSDKERNQFAKQLGISGDPEQWFRKQGFEPPPPEPPEPEKPDPDAPKPSKVGGFLRGLQRGLQGVAQISGYQGGFTHQGRPTRGRQRRRFAAGGFVPGSGSGDTVPALLTPGEWVLTKEQVKRIGTSNLRGLQKFAKGGPVQHFAQGGAVGPPGDDIGQGFAELAGVVGIAADAFEGPGGLTRAVLQGPPALKQFSQNVLAANLRLERWDGRLAASSAMLDRNRLLRQRDEAKATGGTGSVLASSVDDMEKELQELRNAARTMLNVFGIFAARSVTIGTRIVKLVSPIEEILALIEKWIGDDQKKRTPWVQFLNEAASRAKQAGGPQRK